MIAYKIARLAKSGVSDEVGDYDNPHLAKRELVDLRKQFPGDDFAVLRDGTKLTDDQLDDEIKDYEIQEVREDASRLPATYRPGRGSERDDVALGIDGNPTKVWGPDNPEDRYE